MNRHAVKNIVMEKELRLREAMRLMGTRDVSHWSAWFLTSLVLLFISSLLITIVAVCWPSFARFFVAVPHFFYQAVRYDRLDC